MCFSRCVTSKNPYYSIAISAKHRSKLAALHWQEWRFHMTNKQTNTQTHVSMLSSFFNYKIDNLAMNWIVGKDCFMDASNNSTSEIDRIKHVYQLVFWYHVELSLHCCLFFWINVPGNSTNILRCGVNWKTKIKPSHIDKL